MMLSWYPILNPCIAVCSYVWNMFRLLHRKSTCLAWCKNNVALSHGQYVYNIYASFFQWLYIIVYIYIYAHI